jgi:hypothetical protein
MIKHCEDRISSYLFVESCIKYPVIEIPQNVRAICLDETLCSPLEEIQTISLCKIMFCYH